MLVDREDNPKLRKSDRIIVLSPMDDKKPLNASSMVDPDIFTGKNQLHAIMNTRNLMWSFKYERGELPEILKQKFTTFDAALKFATNYFNKRNIKVVEVID